MPSISIIIPYYNSNIELFNQCLNSILQQSFRNYEILIINDGSNEKNSAELDNIKTLDDRITVYWQKNQGVSVARNYGTMLASGKYIIYVDADDYLLPGYLDEAYKIAEEKSADIVYSYVCRTADELFRPEIKEEPDVKEISREWLRQYTVGYYYLDGKKGFGRGPWARIVRSDIAKKVLFPVGVPIGEDVLWNLDIIENTEKRYLIDQMWYMYMIREDSAVGRYTPNILDRLEPFYNKILQYFDEDNSEMIWYYNRLLLDLRTYIYKLYLGNPKNKQDLCHRWKKFNDICAMKPWNRISDSAFYRMANRKEKIKIILFRYRLLFLIWSIRS